MNQHICEIFFENWDCRKVGLGIRVIWGVKCAVCGMVGACVSEEEAKKCMTVHVSETQEYTAGKR